MSREITKTVYTFDELDDRAKEKAREWYREGALDYDWWDSVYEDASEIAERLGIDLKQKPVKLMNGSTRYDPAIYFQGFYTQGSGSSFEGRYAYRKGALKAIQEYAPQDKTLADIATALQATQRRRFYRLTASIETHRDTSIRVYVEEEGRYDCNEDDEAAITSAMEDFNHWIFQQLEKEYEWLMSDENVDDTIRINEYEFDEEGHRV